MHVAPILKWDIKGWNVEYLPLGAYEMGRLVQHTSWMLRGKEKEDADDVRCQIAVF
jgi:hypothetical protein